MGRCSSARTEPKRPSSSTRPGHHQGEALGEADPGGLQGDQGQVGAGAALPGPQAVAPTSADACSQRSPSGRYGDISSR